MLRAVGSFGAVQMSVRTSLARLRLYGVLRSSTGKYVKTSRLINMLHPRAGYVNPVTLRGGVGSSFFLCPTN